MGYWDGVKGRWEKMKKGELPLDDESPKPTPPIPPAQPPSPPMDMIRRKFRQRTGREPYSDQELIDWWGSL